MLWNFGNVFKVIVGMVNRYSINKSNLKRANIEFIRVIYRQKQQPTTKSVTREGLKKRKYDKMAKKLQKYEKKDYQDATNKRQTCNKKNHKMKKQWLKKAPKETTKKDKKKCEYSCKKTKRNMKKYQMAIKNPEKWETKSGKSRRLKKGKNVAKMLQRRSYKGNK